MSRLSWDESQNRRYEYGVKHGVLFAWNASANNNAGAYGEGVAWDGLTAVSDSPSGGDANDIYADDMKYATLRGTEDFGGTIEAYTCPVEFYKCDGSYTEVAGAIVGQQKREKFGLVYETQIGNADDNEAGHMLHLIWGASASPSDRQYQTINDSPDAISLSWEYTTVPVPFNAQGAYKDLKATSCIRVDSTKCTANAWNAITDAVYGNSTNNAYLPTPDEVLGILANNAT